MMENAGLRQPAPPAKFVQVSTIAPAVSHNGAVVEHGGIVALDADGVVWFAPVRVGKSPAFSRVPREQR